MQIGLRIFGGAAVLIAFSAVIYYGLLLTVLGAELVVGTTHKNLIN